MVFYVPVQHPNLGSYPSTQLASASAAGATTITVKTNIIYDLSTLDATNFYVIIGVIGTDKCEIATVSSVSGATSMTVGALSFAHAANEPVQFTPVSSYRLYMSSTKDGTFTSLGTSAIVVNNPMSIYANSNSAATRNSWYKVVYFHAADSVDVFGYPDNVGGYVIADILSNSQPFQLNESFYCSLEDVKLRQGITKCDSDYKIIKQISFVSRKIDEITNRIWDRRNFNSEYYDTNMTPQMIFRDKLYTKYFPIISVSSVTNNGTSLTLNQANSTGFYIVDEDHLELHDGYWTNERRGVVISYVAGYDFVPGYIKDACVEMVLVDLGLKTRTYLDEGGIQQSVTLNKYSEDIMSMLEGQHIPGGF